MKNNLKSVKEVTTVNPTAAPALDANNSIVIKIADNTVITITLPTATAAAVATTTTATATPLTLVKPEPPQKTFRELLVAFIKNKKNVL